VGSVIENCLSPVLWKDRERQRRDKNQDAVLPPMVAA